MQLSAWNPAHECIQGHVALFDAQGLAKLYNPKSKHKASEGKAGASVAVRLVREMVTKGVRLVAVSAYSKTPRDAAGQLAFPGSFPATIDLEFEGKPYPLEYERDAFLLHELVEPQRAAPLKTATLVMKL